MTLSSCTIHPSVAESPSSLLQMLTGRSQSCGCYVRVMKLITLILIRASHGLKISKSSKTTLASALVRGTNGMGTLQETVHAYHPERTNRQLLLRMASGEIPEFDDDVEQGEDSDVDDRTDREKGLTHGYEGDFKKGDNIRVTLSCKIYSVKPFLNEGMDPRGMEGEVTDLVLYGRKKNSLCSAITPIKVKFQPGGVGVPPEIERPFFLHFESSEIERL